VEGSKSQKLIPQKYTAKLSAIRFSKVPQNLKKVKTSPNFTLFKIFQIILKTNIWLFYTFYIYNCDLNALIIRKMYLGAVNKRNVWLKSGISNIF